MDANHPDWKMVTIVALSTLTNFSVVMYPKQSRFSDFKLLRNHYTRLGNHIILSYCQFNARRYFRL